MVRYVINSTNNNLFYSYFVPIVSLMWKRIGYTPVSLLLGTESEWLSTPQSKFIYDNICKCSAKILINRVGGFQDSTIIQISRIFASAMEFKADDYLLTSDADMLPFDKSWFNQQDGSKQFHIFGADAYGGARFPICYLGASAATWRQIMGIRIINLQTALETYLDKRRDNWNYDELLFTEKIKASGLYPHRCHLINRGWPDGRANGRLDRAAWNWQNQSGLIDCHSIRPGHTNWGAIAGVLKKYCSEADFMYINDYTTALLNIR